MKISIKLKTTFLLFLLSIATQASAISVLRFADPGPNRGVRAEAVQFFADEVNRLSEGDLKLEIHWGGTLFKFPDIYKGISAGGADLGAVWASYAPQPLTALGIGDIPLEYSDPWVGMRAMYDLMTSEPSLKSAFADQSIVYLTNFTTGPVQFECSAGNEIRQVEDLKGKRIRATGTYNNVLDDLGAILTAMSFSEVYQALDTGLLDCVGSYFYTMRAYKTYEVAESVTQIDWGQVLGSAIVMNVYIWEDLTEKQKKVLLEAGSKMIDFFGKKMINEIDDVKNSLKSGKFGKTVPVESMPDEERQKILEASLKYRDEWINKANKIGLNGDKIWNRYIELLNHYDSIQNNEGYPWSN